jgi:succinate dehydrogenase / fumarate reductase flavoprotein subunit
MIGSLDSKIPDGPLEKKWDQHKFDVKLVNPPTSRYGSSVGSGFGASAAATLGELG